jgi:hypothetical protein
MAKVTIELLLVGCRALLTGAEPAAQQVAKADMHHWANKTMGIVIKTTKFIRAMKPDDQFPFILIFLILATDRVLHIESDLGFIRASPNC